MFKKNKSKTALAKISSTNLLYEELTNTTVGDLSMRLDSLENFISEYVTLIDDFSNLRNEIASIKNQNLTILQEVQNMFNEINIKTISNEKTALQINTISLRLSIEFANANINNKRLF